MQGFIKTSRHLVIATLAVATLQGCNKKDDTATSAPEPSAVAAPEFPGAPMTSARPDTVLAIVNGTEITQAELDNEINTMMNRMQGRMPPERLAQMRMQMQSQMLENLVNRQVMMSKIASENITVSDEEFEAGVAELTANLPEGASLDMMLAQSGTTMEDFRENFGTELKVRKLIESKSGGKIEATTEEARAFYEENAEQFERPESVEASHILIAVAEDDDKDARRAELEAIRAQLREGADFAELAMEHSTCPSKAQGGSLGDFTRGRMVPEFEEAAFTQAIGEVGEIVETQFGFHLIKVTGRSQAGSTPFEEVEEQLTRYLSGQKQQKVARELIESLVEEANISYPGR